MADVKTKAFGVAAHNCPSPVQVPQSPGKIHSEGFTLRGAVGHRGVKLLLCSARPVPGLFMAPPPGGRPPRLMAAPLPAQMKPKNYSNLALNTCTFLFF